MNSLYLIMNAKQSELYYLIALTQTPMIGDKTARQLLNRLGSATAIYDTPAKQLAALPNMGVKLAQLIKNSINNTAIEKEIAFITKHNIKAIDILSPDYPNNLKQCEDAPILFYYKGDSTIWNGRTVAVIGTRKNTEYGAKITEDLITQLQHQNISIISGMALGIDSIAHKKALQLGMPTLGVMAHGLDSIYPPQHKQLAKDILQHNGGLLTEYTSGTTPEKFNFPMRNRIVAGLSDVTVVVETEHKGGAMITAKLAASYNREVMAFPGRTIDKKSEGCNYLIKTNIARSITHATDLLELMNWDSNQNTRIAQAKLFHHLTDDEQKIIQILESSEGMHIDEIMLKSNMHSTQLSALLLQLELSDYVKPLPGKRFRIQ
jgi:DNA processing protein